MHIGAWRRGKGLHVVIKSAKFVFSFAFYHSLPIPVTQQKYITQGSEKFRKNGQILRRVAYEKTNAIYDNEMGSLFRENKMQLPKSLNEMSSSCLLMTCQYNKDSQNVYQLEIKGHVRFTDIV